MDRLIRARVLGSVALFGFCIALGCGQSTQTEAPPAASSKQTTSDPATEAVARAAADFLDAVLKGETQRASARLTPQAMQRIIASGKQFAPPGLETATFRIGRVRIPAEGQAFVECVLTDTASGTPHSEEMCCALRFVENDWRISGIAYATTPDQPWTLTNFETGQNIAVPRPATTQATPAAAPAANRPSPPRTAQEPPAMVR